MKTYFIEGQNLVKFYNRIAETYELFVPKRIKSSSKVECSHGFELPADDYVLSKYDAAAESDPIFNDYRTIEPVRLFFTHFKEKVCDYFNGAVNQEPGAKPPAISGVKNCDLFALKVQDYVFLEGNEVDPFYKTRRENALIICGDCPNFKEVCFCSS